MATDRSAGISSGDDSTALVILNPVAGPNAQRLLQRDRLARALTDAGLPVQWHETTAIRGADAIIDANPGDTPVIVIGGDGTVQAACRSLIGSDRPLLIVPRGSGNVLALRLGLSPRLSVALELLRKGHLRRIDVGSHGGEPFLLGVGMGIDARIIRAADRQLKQQMGKLAYVWGAAKNLPVLHQDFEIEIDGRTVHERGASVLVANFGSVIGPLVFPPGAIGDDGLLDVAVIKAENLEQTLSVLASPFLPKHTVEKGMKVMRARKVHVRCVPDLPVQVDGEDMGDHREISCEIDERKLTVVAPLEDVD